MYPAQRLTFVLTLLIGSLLALGQTATRQVAAATAQIAIVNFAYAPADRTVQVGDTVTWTNGDTVAHTVSSTSNGWDSGPLTTQQEFSRTFNTAGTFAYICTFHASMRGTITVTAPAAAAPRVYLPLMQQANSATQPSTPVPAPLVPIGNTWSNPASWPGGTVPKAGAYVVIPEGITMTLDISPPPLRALQIDGGLTFAERDLNLTANWIMVHRRGVFQIGTLERPFRNKLVITLTGNSPDENMMGMGTKFLGAMMGGKIRIYGEDRVSWTNLNATSAIGATQLTLTQAVEWRVGEQIVVASSSLEPSEAEVRTITAISGAVVTLDRPLLYRHWGVLQTVAGKSLDERAEVGLLSRNIVIQGDEQSVATKFGGHVMIMGSSATIRETDPLMRSSARVRGVEFRRMGQFNHLGHYPFHWHLNGSSPGDMIENSAVHDSIQRGIVIHGTDGVLVKNNVVYNTIGHAYMVEDSTERASVFDHNLGLLPQPATFTQARLATQNDTKAATFWLRTAAVALTANASAGGWFAGYWFDMGFAPGENNATKASLVFRNNVVHSHQSGKDANSEQESWAIWHTDGFVPSADGVMRFENILAYKNARAIETSGRGVTINSILADNGIGFTNHLVQNSVIVSQSANSDTNQAWGATGMFAYGGYANTENVTWVGFKDGRMIARTLACGIEYPRFAARSSILIDSEPMAGCGDAILNDIDGSLSGTSQPAKLVNVEGRIGWSGAGSNDFGLVTADCQVHITGMPQGYAVCPNYDYRALSVTYPTGQGFVNSNWRVDVVRDEDSNRQTPKHFRWVAYIIPGKLYRLEVRSRLNDGDPVAYPLTSLDTITLGLSVGDEAEPNLLLGGRNLVYDSAAASRTVMVYAAIPSGSYRIRSCDAGQQCPQDGTQWTQIGAATSMGALQSSEGAGYFVDGAAGRIYFKFGGGDQLRIER